MRYAIGGAIIAAIALHTLGVLALPVIIVALFASGIAARRGWSLRRSIGVIAPILAVVLIIEFALLFLYSFTFTTGTYVKTTRVVLTPIGTPAP